MAPPLPAPFSTAGGAKLPTCPSGYGLGAPPSTSRRRRQRSAPTPPQQQQEHGAAASAKKNPTRARPDPFVRTLVKAMWVTYLLSLAPSALVGSAIFCGGESTFLLLGVSSLGVITGALFHVREDEDKEAQASSNA